MKKNMQQPAPSLGQTIPHPLGTDLISINTKYYKIGKAAEILKCSADDIVHLGSLGKMEIMAPVLSGSMFEWPIGSAGIPFPELEKPFSFKFTVADRVILSKFDLASIEATGEATPNYFFLPSKARSAIADFEAFSLDEMEPFELEIKNEKGEKVGSTTILKQVDEPTLTENQIALRELSYHSPWHKAQPNINEKTETNTIGDQAITIDNLFVSKEEIIRIINGTPQGDDAKKINSQDDEVSYHENINYQNRHSSKREPILIAAIYCLTQKLGRNISAAKLTQEVELVAPRFYPETGSFPLTTKTIEGHLSAAIAGRPTTTKKFPE
ncbi:hypothetical protein H3H36_08450 [Duganella sp. FT3S]|uniref:Uncharacterized protein n=1 Tax=Rugamonas fusca TaxID=2758568 RepID=A0A7W2I6F4_9BURK|nr:hypothetical protein [Rugamonas fusca]MBA5605389.1 hypothetical protein [Rugamonas fusca]